MCSQLLDQTSKAFPRPGRSVAFGEVSSEPDHDEPASGPNFPIAGDTTGTPESASQRLESRLGDFATFDPNGVQRSLPRIEQNRTDKSLESRRWWMTLELGWAQARRSLSPKLRLPQEATRDCVVGQAARKALPNDVVIEMEDPRCKSLLMTW